MYRLERTKDSYRVEPWAIPYERRIGVLKAAKAAGRHTAAFLYPHFDSSTFRYRAYNPSQTLEYSFWWSGAYFVKADLKKLWKDLCFLDVLVVIRCGWTQGLESFLKAAKAKGIRLCYDVDDLIYHPKHMLSVIEALGLSNETELDFWFGQTERNCMTAKMCDSMITTNQCLAEHLQEDFGKPCYVLQNYLNWVQEKVSQEYFEAKRALEPEKPFIIGYFSGSPTHEKDLMVALPALEEFLMEHEDTRLTIVGYMELSEKYSYLVKRQKIRFVPFQTFVGLQYEQAVVDVNIVPLVNNLFSNCKSELKYFESAIVGTVTCATPVHSYAKAITDGKNGYLCKKDQWLSVLEKLYRENEGSRSRRQSCIRERALEQYANRKQLSVLEHMLDDILKM